MPKTIVLIVLVLFVFVATNAQNSFQSFMNQQAQQKTGNDVTVPSFQSFMNKEAEAQGGNMEMPSFQSFMNQNSPKKPEPQLPLQGTGASEVLADIAHLTQTINSMPNDAPQEDSQPVEEVFQPNDVEIELDDGSIRRFDRRSFNSESELIRRNEARFEGLLNSNRQNSLIRNTARRERELNRRLARRIQNAVRRNALPAEKRTRGDDFTVSRGDQLRLVNTARKGMLRYARRQRQLSRRIERREEEREKQEEMERLQRRVHRRLQKDIERRRRRRSEQDDE